MLKPGMWIKDIQEFCYSENVSIKFEIILKQKYF